MSVAVVALGVVGLGLTGCDGGPSPIIGTATAGQRSALVSWHNPVAAPGAIYSYVVTPWIGFVRQHPTVVCCWPSSLTASVTELTNGVAYGFTVHAVDANGDESAESGMSNRVVPDPASGAPLPPIQSFPQAGDTPPPADAITGIDHSGGYDFQCSPWYLQHSYVGQPAASTWWEYSCQSVWMPCHAICNADWGGHQTFTDHYYWDGSAPVHYGQWFYDGYWDQTYTGTFCDYWIEASGTYGPFACVT